MTITRFYPYAKTVDRVLRWCDWYTRDLDERVARERRDEILSDLWEHAGWAERRNEAPDATSRAIIGRAIFGAVSDLSWRRAQRRRDRVEGAPAEPGTARTALPLAFTVASLVLAFGLLALFRGVVGAAPRLYDGRLTRTTRDGHS
jgi:hypothetical protein